VSVDHSGEDAVGLQLAFEVREAIRKSSSFELSTRADALFRVDLITLDPDKHRSGSGRWMVAAVVFTMKNWIPYDEKDPQTWYPIHLDAAVVIAGSNAVDSQARTIIASLDEAIEEFRRQMAAP
jgi:hypothetical protein